MLKKFNLILILGLSFFYSPSYTKEISKGQEHVSSNIEEIAEEMIHLNSNLESLSITISNLMPENSI